MASTTCFSLNVDALVEASTWDNRAAVLAMVELGLGALDADVSSAIADLLVRRRAMAVVRALDARARRALTRCKARYVRAVVVTLACSALGFGSAARTTTIRTVRRCRALHARVFVAASDVTVRVLGALHTKMVFSVALAHHTSGQRIGAAGLFYGVARLAGMVYAVA